MSTADPLRARLVMLRELGLLDRCAEVTLEGVKLYPAPPPAPRVLSAKERDDTERDRAASVEAWERRVATGASGGLRPQGAPRDGARASTLAAEIRRERAGPT